MVTSAAMDVGEGVAAATMVVVVDTGPEEGRAPPDAQAPNERRESGSRARMGPSEEGAPSVPARAPAVNRLARALTRRSGAAPLAAPEGTPARAGLPRPRTPRRRRRSAPPARRARAPRRAPRAAPPRPRRNPGRRARAPRPFPPRPPSPRAARGRPR